MAKYKQINSRYVKDTETGQSIPLEDALNAHARAYQKWLARGNTPDPADPPPPPPPVDDRIKEIPGSVNSVAALRAKVNEILEYLRRE